MEKTKDYLKELNKKQEQKKKELLKPNPKAKHIDKKELLNNLNSNKKEVTNFSVKIDKDLKEQFYFIAKNSNIKNKDLINNIFLDYFKKRALERDFLKLDNPYYFNVVELLEQKETKAISKAPETNQFNYYIIDAIPINFNAWNKNYNSYCFNNEFNHHKGIIFNCFIVNNDLYKCFLVFELIDNDLLIKCYNKNELELIINPENKGIIKEISQEFYNYNAYETLNSFNQIDINPIDNINNLNYNVFKPLYVKILMDKLNINDYNNKDLINIKNNMCENNNIMDNSTFNSIRRSVFENKELIELVDRFRK